MRRADNYKTYLRPGQGETLVSIVVATLLMTIVAAGIMALAVLNNSESTRVCNKVDSVNAARTAVDRIGRVIREARTVGDYYGEVSAPSQAPYNPINTGGATGPNASAPSVQAPNPNLLPSAEFPSAGDPIYSSTANPAFTSWPTCSCHGLHGPTNAYLLSTNTLIVQIPVFTPDGFPCYAKNSGGYNVELTDTYVYEIVPDNAADALPGTCLLQETVFPGAPDPPWYPASSAPATAMTFPFSNGWTSHTSPRIKMVAKPQVILRGIVGPWAPGQDTTPTDNNLPLIFQYIFIDSTNPGTSVLLTPAAGQDLSTSIPQISGIVVNLEVLRENAVRAQKATLAFKSELYMRNNTLTTLIGN